MNAPDLARARRFVAAHPPPGTPLLVAVTGAHLYGFPSKDSDVDLKGLHEAPLEALLGLEAPPETHDALLDFEGYEDVLELVAVKAAGQEKGPLAPALDAAHRARWPALEAELDAALEASPLPEAPPGRDAIDAWLRARRLASRA